MTRTIKFILWLFLLLVFTNSVYAKHNKEEENLRSSLIDYSKKYLGCHYKAAGKGPKHFDCSGFSAFVFKEFGYTLNSSSSSQYLQGEKVKTSKAEIGDLIFFTGSNAKSKNVGHVGIICEVKEDTLLFIHASVSNGIIIDAYPGLDYYNKRFIGCRKIIGEIDSFKPNDNNDETEQSEDAKDDNIVESDSSTTKTDTIPVEPKESYPSDNTTETTIESIIHIVKKGDNLYKLSRKYNCTVDIIMKLNHLQSNNISIGQQLTIIRDCHELPTSR